MGRKASFQEEVHEPFLILFAKKCRLGRFTFSKLNFVRKHYYLCRYRQSGQIEEIYVASHLPCIKASLTFDFSWNISLSFCAILFFRASLTKVLFINNMVDTLKQIHFSQTTNFTDIALRLIRSGATDINSILV